jgi:dihydrofolate synthase / folylpolyglutamate synthase
LALQDTSSALLNRFLALHPRKIDLSLVRIQTLLAKLDSPQTSLPAVIHVAGTNGKGSVIAFIRAILEAAGKSVHVYTSPHLVNFHERIRLGEPHDSATGGPAGSALVEEVELVKILAECERINAGDPITVFEMITAAALTLFSRHRADYLLLEVGLGGRYDATNVVEQPAVCVITPVSLDHLEFLGDDLAGIAREKAGIIKAGVPVITGWQQAPALDVIEKEAARMRAPALVAGQDFNCYEQNGRYVYEDGMGLLDLPYPALEGQHQLENAAVAIAAVRQLLPDLPDQAFEKGLENVHWPARMQRLTHGPLVDMAPPGSELWLDGGHNPAGGEVLASVMGDMDEHGARPVILICGTLATKDTAGFLRPFQTLVREVIAVPVHGEHASRSAEDTMQIAQSVDMTASAAKNVEAALQMITARQWPVPPRILIAGSLYLAGEVLRANAVEVI